MATVENLSTAAAVNTAQSGDRTVLASWLDRAAPLFSSAITHGLRFAIADVDTTAFLLYGYTLSFTLDASGTYDVEDNDAPAVAVFALKVPVDDPFVSSGLVPTAPLTLGSATAENVVTGLDHYADTDWLCVGILPSSSPLALGVTHSIQLGEDRGGAVDVNMGHAWKSSTGGNKQPPWLHASWGGGLHLSVESYAVGGGTTGMQSISLSTIVFPELTGKEGPWRANSRVSRCNRCSGIMPREMFIKDGFKYPLLVCKDCWDPRDPWEKGFPNPREGRDRQEYE